MQGNWVCKPEGFLTGRAKNDIMEEKIECPFCDGYANLKKEEREVNYRKELFKIAAHFYQCEKCGEELTTTEADTVSLMQLPN